MAFVQAKCPNCGGFLAVDNEKDAAVCQFCNTPFIVEKAINNFNISVNGNVTIDANNASINVSSGPSEDALLGRAKDFLKNEDYEDAISYFNKVLDLNPNNAEAKRGLVNATELIQVDYSIPDFKVSVSIGDKVKSTEQFANLYFLSDCIKLDIINATMHVESVKESYSAKFSDISVSTYHSKYMRYNVSVMHVKSAKLSFCMKTFDPDQPIFLRSYAAGLNHFNNFSIDNEEFINIKKSFKRNNVPIDDKA